MDTPTKIQTWLADRGEPAIVEPMAGGASPRTYWRVRRPDGATRVVMALPDDPFRPDEAADLPTSAELPWLVMQRKLSERGLPVPAVYAVALDRGLVMIEDLGDWRFFDMVQALGEYARGAAYGGAVALLVRFQTATADLVVPATFGPVHMRAELDEFRAMGLEARLGITLDSAERATFDAVAYDLIARLDALPKVFAHRDFQSQNLMVTDRGLVLIDFQDAFMAPAVYDAVALLRDSYVVLPPAELDQLLAAAGFAPDAFHLQTIQRKLKDAGRFETLARRGKTHFLAYYADSIRYVVHALVVTGLYPELLALLRRYLAEAW